MIPSCAILPNWLADRYILFLECDNHSAVELRVFGSRSFSAVADHSLSEVQLCHSALTKICTKNLIKNVLTFSSNIFLLPAFSRVRISVLLNKNYLHQVHLLLPQFDVEELCALQVLQHCSLFFSILVQHARSQYSVTEKSNVLFFFFHKCEWKFFLKWTFL